MKPEYLLKQAGMSPVTMAALSAGIGGGAGYLMDLWKERSGTPVEHKWLRPAIWATLAATPAMVYGMGRSSYDAAPDGSHGLSLKDRWLTDDKTFWEKSPYAYGNLNARDMKYRLAMSDKYQNKYLFNNKTASFGLDPINVNDFNQEIWADASRGQTPIQSAGFVSNTLNQTSNRFGSNLVTPGQVINTMVNAGIGYGTAWLAGKTLGALAGVSPETQHKLQEIGTWGGILNGIGNAASHY